jgi:hypothetical protein
MGDLLPEMAANGSVVGKDGRHPASLHPTFCGMDAIA